MFRFLDRAWSRKGISGNGGRVVIILVQQFGQPLYWPGAIKASFDLPALFPQGDYDVGIIIAGRPDTAYWDGKVHVVGAPAASWTSFLQQLPWRSQFMATAEGRNLPGNPALAAYTLRRGVSVIAGTFKSAYTSAQGVAVNLSFNPDSTSDTGWYDFQADFAGIPPVRFEHALRLAGPALDPLQRTVWNQGQADSLWVSVTGVEFPWLRADASPKAENLERFSLCRESQCLDIVGTSRDSRAGTSS